MALFVLHSTKTTRGWCGGLYSCLPLPCQARRLKCIGPCRAAAASSFRSWLSSAASTFKGDGGGRWQEYIAPSGDPYYYNLDTKETQWERPAGYVAPACDQTRSRRIYKQQEVPADPLSRAAGFAALGVKLAAGAASETLNRVTGTGASSNGGQSSALLSEANASTLAAELCRMRGAALKVGQMLSLQDSQVLPAPLAQALDAVRTTANVMPPAQLHEVMSDALGPNWHSKFAHFGERPVAAASVGQVHKAALHDGRAVAVKVQYPGVAASISSDLQNLEMLLRYVLRPPPGLFLDRIVEVARRELTDECDYLQEARHQSEFAELIRGDPDLIVPAVVPELSGKSVLTSEWMNGQPIDEVAGLPEDERNAVARAMLRLCLKEVFEFRKVSRKIALIDFGATRTLPKPFVDDYVQLVWAAAERDRESLLEASIRMGFLTGAESTAMTDAHIAAGLIAGEPFAEDSAFDFAARAGGPGGMTERMAPHVAVFARERVCPPPKEVYALHRKLSGAITTCTKLRVTIPCRDLLTDTVANYQPSG